MDIGPCSGEIVFKAGSKFVESNTSIRSLSNASSSLWDRVITDSLSLSLDSRFELNVG